MKVRRSAPWSFGIAGACTVSAIAIAIAIASFSSLSRIDRQGLARPSQAELDAANPTLRKNAGYVGSDSCVACHPSEHKSWANTFHRTMTQRASPAAVLAPFDGRELVGVDGSYRVEQRGVDEFWVRMVDPEAKLAAATGREELGAGPQVWRRVVMTTGSHHLQVYWVTGADGRRLFAFPFSYLIDDRRWVANESTLLRPPGGEAVYTWNQVCIQCHAVGGIPGAFDQPGQSGTSASAVVELGIACEACHGPGKEHLQSHRNPLRRYRQHLRGAPDPTIINPTRLDPTAASEICGQCHSAAVFADESAWRQHGPTFRPGGHLEPDLKVVRHPLRANQAWLEAILKADPGFVEGRLWGDGMIRIVGREFSGLIESPCYQRGELSCLSCHQLHGAPADDQLAPNMRGDRACTSCHQTYVDKNTAARHSHHTPASTGSRCYNCHMPHTTYGLLGASRSHEISVPEVDGSIQGVRPNACNLCHLDKTLDWASRYLQRWYGIDAPIVEKEAKGIAAGFAWALAGDASQRALAAWHMGWTPALAASGKSWVAPVLALLLEDPYDAVRYIAGRSLARLPGYEDLDYDYVGTPTQRTAIAREVERRWQALSEHRRDAELLRDPEGNLRTLAIAELLEGRDRRPIDLRE